MRVVKEFRNSNRKQQHFLRTLLLDQESAPLLQRQQSRNIMKRHPHQAHGSIPYGAHMRKKISRCPSSSRQHCTVGSCPLAVQVSLACHYRVAAPKASVGFPEVRGAMGSH